MEKLMYLFAMQTMNQDTVHVVFDSSSDGESGQRYSVNMPLAEARALLIGKLYKVNVVAI